MKEVRPTSGRVRSALFNILGTMEGRSFLDLFAGTGRMGLEAMKRGAGPVVWVESLRARAQAIEKEACGEGGENIVLSLELRRALAWLSKRGRTFDYIFADPPYHEGWGAELLKVRGLEGLLAPEGVLVVEHSVREALILTPAWELTSERDYGETRLSFLFKPAGEKPSASGAQAEAPGLKLT
ncbi:MAG: RsmD family RNA methyltransferase [Fretibacterium sp.]|nr:RsmD family RNA methyltransferase [Fretibacterium sp.]